MYVTGGGEMGEGTGKDVLGVRNTNQFKPILHTVEAILRSSFLRTYIHASARKLFDRSSVD